MKIDMRTSGVSLHFEKHKGNDVGVNGLQRHNERVAGQKHSNKKINDSRTNENVFLRRSNNKYNKAISGVIEQEREGGLKGVRKDAVRMVEATVQLSGKVLDMSETEQEQILRDSYSWLKEQFGEENVISAVIHKDETNMHLHFDFVPIEDNKLIAKTIISKPRLKQYQNDFLKSLQDKHISMNFERGGGLTNGLSQQDFETLREERAKMQKEADEREDELDNREESLDAREELLTGRERILNKRVTELNTAVKQANDRARVLSDNENAFAEMKAKVSMAIQQLKEREKAVKTKEATVVKWNTHIKLEKERLNVREAEVDKKDVEATRKLLKASGLNEQVKALNERMKDAGCSISERFNRLVQSVKRGDISPRQVEQLADKHTPIENAEQVEKFSIDLDKLLNNNDKAL